MCGGVSVIMVLKVPVSNQILLVLVLSVGDVVFYGVESEERVDGVVSTFGLLR